MSSTLNVYLLNLADLTAVVGSADEKLLDQILTSEPEVLLLGFERDDQDDHVERNKEALRKILAGGPFEEEHAAHYGEALQLICEELAGPGYSGVEFVWWDEGLPSVVETLASSMDDEDPFPNAPALAESLSVSEDNGWGHLSAKECIEILGHGLEQQLAEDPDYLDGYGEPILVWLRESRTSGKDLIGFWNA
ncbi:hypothetical protein QX204_24765 [Nocardia sp. PE-7]|uniref:DUF7691 family protein n=1 Tax=Nocardia sp. PE-7 TaxID=3058426 RepID=UPI002659917B|nr:hypothetical protein [Nocardia sp. PE-7]WKG08255.1 hypothetical protein QX204_24765 [Nocardia sp. PE-7]